MIEVFNDFYYIHKDKYNKEINSLNTENKNKLDYKKLRLLMIISIRLKKNKKKQKLI